MPDLPPTLLAAFAGFVTALLFSSIPVGPINLTIINEGSQRGFRWALLIGLGASLMEVIYCSLAFTGFSSLFENRTVKSAMEVFSFVFLLFLGAKFLSAQTVNVPTRLDAASKKIERRLDEKLHPHSAFMTGFVRVMGNLGVLLTWMVLAAYLMSHDAYFTSRYWVADRFAAKLACVAGVLLGTNTWFFVLSFSVSRGHGKFSEKSLLRMQRVSGFCLLLAGLYGGAHVVWQLARHRIIN
ncbi:MAG TPA: LysE family transporter [Candidatus Paceibacterota bacterium]|nr:LysE family transporter [Candidatus Paceibacterota bacterium]